MQLTMQLAVFFQVYFARAVWSCITDSTNIEVRLGNTDYILVRKPATWWGAVNYCHTIERALAVLPNLPVATAIIDLIQSISEPYSEALESGFRECDLAMDTRYWIGLSDLAEAGHWQWAHYGYDLIYELWFENQPDGSRGRVHDCCVSLWNPNWFLGQKHKFNDDDCNKAYYFICGFERIINNPVINITTEVSLLTSPSTTTTRDVEPETNQPLPVAEETTTVTIIETPTATTIETTIVPIIETTTVKIIETTVPVPTEPPTITTTTEFRGRNLEGTPKPFPSHHLKHKNSQLSPAQPSAPPVAPAPLTVVPPAAEPSQPPVAPVPTPVVTTPIPLGNRPRTKTPAWRFEHRVAKDKKGHIRAKDRGNRGG